MESQMGATSGENNFPMVNGNGDFPYKDVCAQRPQNYSYYAKHDIEWGDLANYEINQKLGRGKYSEVY
jgi:hypothetical protein